MTREPPIPLTRVDLLEQASRLGISDVDASKDFLNSIGKEVLRCRFDDQRAVAVGSDAGAKVQIAALLDLLHLHLTGDGTYAGRPVRPDQVTIIIGSGPEAGESSDALGILADSLVAGPQVHVMASGPDSTLALPPLPSIDLSDVAHYPDWPQLLSHIGTEPSALLTSITDRVNLDALRGYPMLTSGGWWSLRLEGLEVGRFRGDKGWLDVGKDGKTRADGTTARSEARRMWQESTDATDNIEVESSDLSVDRAANVVAAFAAKYLPELQPDGTAPIKQNEHALESRILRAATQVTTKSGIQLQVIREDPRVNWGSQFPTKWGRGGSARYLDAMLRDGRIPWAVEMKVQGGSGVGRYYGVAQAVLYREFIKVAHPLKGWFDRYDLDQTLCRAAVVVPELLGKQAKWTPALEAAANAFDVDLIQIPHHHAGLH